MLPCCLLTAATAVLHGPAVSNPHTPTAADTSYTHYEDGLKYFNIDDVDERRKQQSLNFEKKMSEKLKG